MNSSIYIRLASANMKNNWKTYIPYIFTAILTVMMYYIMDSLSQNGSVKEENVQLILNYACRIIVVFSVIFLFYTNSFLIKRRKKEIGVYNILGMGKRHIAKMLTIETIFTAIVSVAAGLALGVAFSKLMWLVLLRLLHYDVGMNFEVSAAAMVRTLVLFGVIFAMTLCYNLLQIRLANPVELLRGSNQGEKEPKTKWVLTLFGILALGIGYYIALTTESPIAALEAFFLAVICVVLGTYALFIAGSIALLKMLRKNKKYYYKMKHFTAISGMIYRMKQNAVGLANICILSTMVLVMVSTTVSLYVGMEDVLKTRFPHEIAITKYKTNAEDEERIREIVVEETEKNEVEITDELEYHIAALSAVKEGTHFSLTDQGSYGTKNVCEFYMILQEDYNRMESDDMSLAPDEVIVYTTEKALYGKNTIQIDDQTYRVAKELKSMKLEPKNASRIVEGYYVIFADEAPIQAFLQSVSENSSLQEEWKQRSYAMQHKWSFDLKGKEKDCTAATEGMQGRITNEIGDSVYESREMSRGSFYSLYGSLLFIGIYLGFLFLMATVLIIYYKQISEGYDDKERYQIMQKVGMSKREVRSSIRSQILTVFFLPLVVAIIHIAVAFKVITKLLAVLNLVNVPLFLSCTIATVVVFAIFYGIVFGMTAKEYYRIVN